MNHLFYVCFTFLLIPTWAFAWTKPTLKDIPNALICSLKTENELLRNRGVNISNIRSEVTFVGLDAHSSGPADIGIFSTIIGASNECDNDYTAIFVTDDLIDFETGKRDSIIGILNYFNAAQECNDGHCNLRTTEIITCKRP